MYSVQISNSSIWPINRTLSGVTTLGQSEPGSNGNEGVLCIPQSCSITGASPSDCLVLYPRHSLGKSYSSAEIQLVYSTAKADWPTGFWVYIIIKKKTLPIKSIQPWTSLPRLQRTSFYQSTSLYIPCL